jgi:uncharacterized protein YciI
MLILSLTYKKPIEEVERHSRTHLDWVKEGYERGLFLASGRKVPRTGGVILAKGKRADIEAFLESDPFVIHGIGDYDITEMAVSMTIAGLEALCD